VKANKHSPKSPGPAAPPSSNAGESKPRRVSARQPFEGLREAQRLRQVESTARRPASRAGNATPRRTATAPKACQPVAFYVPADFDLAILPEHLRDYAAYFLNLVHWKWVCWRADRDGFVRLKYDYLTRVIPKEHWVKLVHGCLTGFDRLPGSASRTYPAVIEIDGCEQGVKCRGYRLAPGYRRVRRVACTDDALSRRIREVYARAEGLPLLPVHRWLRDHLGRLDFDFRKALAVIATMEPEDECAMDVGDYRQLLAGSCQRLADGEHFLTCDPYGRVHTLATCLPKALRGCLSVGGRPLVGLDLKNSQPLIAGLCARQFYRSSASSRCRLANVTFGRGGHPYCYRAVRGLRGGPGVPADVEDYVRVCEQGRFYESFMGDDDDRDRFKRAFFRNVFFGRSGVRSAVKAAFTRRHPSVAAMLGVLKGKDYRRAAWVLQNVESTLFIHLVCGRRILKERPDVPLFTVHDSLLTVPEAAGDVRALILSEFGRLGVTPRLREERYDADRPAKAR
jgi:hypothetical protein